MLPVCSELHSLLYISEQLELSECASRLRALKVRFDFRLSSAWSLACIMHYVDQYDWFNRPNGHRHGHGDRHRHGQRQGH